MRISDWSSDVCSSDLTRRVRHLLPRRPLHAAGVLGGVRLRAALVGPHPAVAAAGADRRPRPPAPDEGPAGCPAVPPPRQRQWHGGLQRPRPPMSAPEPTAGGRRRFRPTTSEEHTSELQSLMRLSYAVFCLKKKNT